MIVWDAISTVCMLWHCVELYSLITLLSVLNLLRVFGGLARLCIMQAVASELDGHIGPLLFWLMAGIQNATAQFRVIITEWYLCMLMYLSTSRCTLQKQSSVSAANCTRTQTVCRHIHEAFWQLFIGFCCFCACHQTFFINFRFSTRTIASGLLLFMGCNFLLTICCNTSEREFFMNKYVIACSGCRFGPVVVCT